jgi:hypothetical protein
MISASHAGWEANRLASGYNRYSTPDLPVPNCRFQNRTWQGRTTPCRVMHGHGVIQEAGLAGAAVFSRGGTTPLPWGAHEPEGET